MHRIFVIADSHSINPQARTYAEYRVFAVVARHTHAVRRVRLVLRQAKEDATGTTVSCSVTVHLEPSGSLRIRATGSHAYAAINRAIEQLDVAMERRLALLA
jgi:ribosome-associated translation inhibitor RaiA